MGCTSCKNKGKKVDFTVKEEDGDFKVHPLSRLIYFILAIIAGTIIVIPVIWAVGLYVLFKTIIMNESTDILPSLTFLGNLFLKYKKDEDEDDDYVDIDTIDPEEYEIVGLEEIKK